MFRGCYTALVTPMRRYGEVDYPCLETLVDFQVSQGVSGVLAVGTTGESATLTWKEHIRVIEKVHEYNADRSLTIASTGSNCTREAMEATRDVQRSGIKAVLLVDPYYNGPSSLEIRQEYVTPMAKRFPEIQFMPYIIPGRTGTQLLPQDLAVLHSNHPNVRSVKEATGDLENMKLTRKFCGDDFDILSGDDDKTFSMMTDRAIRASGVVSVTSNVAPGAVQKMATLILEGKLDEAKKLADALKPLFETVTVKTVAQTPFGDVSVKARNPLPCKTLMNILGMPGGPLRQPLGKMTEKGLQVVLEAARKVYENNRGILEPIEDAFDVDLSKRLYEEKSWKGLAYD